MSLTHEEISKIQLRSDILIPTKDNQKFKNNEMDLKKVKFGGDEDNKKLAFLIAKRMKIKYVFGESGVYL
jgi:hypothetical protein